MDLNTLEKNVTLLPTPYCDFSVSDEEHDAVQATDPDQEQVFRQQLHWQISVWQNRCICLRFEIPYRRFDEYQKDLRDHVI